MAKSALDRLTELCNRIAPGKPPHEAYSLLLEIITEAGNITRCKPQARLIIQKLDELA